jgi:phosphoglycolate phosphatase
MIDALEHAAGQPASRIERRLQEVHREWEMTECPACLRALAEYGDFRRGALDEIACDYDRRFVASAPVFDGIPDALERLRRAGTRVVAYTESPGSFTGHRLGLLGLDAFDALYAREEEPCWSGEAAHLRCETIPVARGALKPDPRVLRGIASDARIPLDRVLFVGDNLCKDVAMARAAGARAAWARYGTARDAEADALLARLCHWTPEQARYERAAAATVRADVVLERRFDELFDHFSFTC